MPPMSVLTRIKNRLLRATRGKAQALAYAPWESEDIPWAPAVRSPRETVLALVTTGGLHHRDQRPFDMRDPDGDPTWRELDLSRPRESLTMTHDYYDHSDAERDLNVIFPIDRLEEMRREGLLGGLACRHFGFMGHIAGRHLPTLVEKTAPEVAGLLASDGVGCVLLTPG